MKHSSRIATLDRQEIIVMTSQKAFWQALVTVGVPSILILGTSLYMTGFREDEWTIYAFLILLPVILLTPLVYSNYKKGRSSQKPTRDDYLKRAFLTGGIAVAYSILAFFQPEHRHGLFMNWMMPIGWIAATVIHLWNASKAEKTRYLPNE
jgi:hypothetical protein